MKMHGVKASLIACVTLLPTFLHAVELHQPAPMMASAPALKNSYSQHQVVGDFPKAYQRANKPRIAIYLNREASASSKQWYTPVVVSSATVDNRGNASYSETAVHINKGGEPERRSQDTRFHEFESVFYNAMLSQGVRLVDPNLMQRLAAENAPFFQNIGSGMAGSSLAKNVDIVIELLIIPSSTTASGYSFRAQASSVSDAQIIAFSTLDNVHPGEGRFIAGKKGFERANASNDPNFHKELARQLANNLMNNLARVW